ALDNVGSGRTSLETLIHFSPDLVKVDRHLISGIGKARGKSRTLERLLGVLQILNTQVAAVGIESEDDLKALRDLGVPIGQGFAMKDMI
ncbi:MAG: EAL domain-containing protein (putative c-di-GMP-specific phosphodiesterase class I), partial [Myxococcota bacterium]